MFLPPTPVELRRAAGDVRRFRRAGLVGAELPGRGKAPRPGTARRTEGPAQTPQGRQRKRPEKVRRLHQRSGKGLPLAGQTPATEKRGRTRQTEDQVGRRRIPQRSGRQHLPGAEVRRPGRRPVPRRRHRHVAARSRPESDDLVGRLGRAAVLPARSWSSASRQQAQAGDLPGPARRPGPDGGLRRGRAWASTRRCARWPTK